MSPEEGGRSRGPWLALPLLAATLGLGAVHPPVRLAVGLLAAAVAVAVGWHWRRPSRAVGQVLGLATAGLVASALALVPVGAGVRAWLQPGLAARVDASLAEVGGGVHALAVHPASAWSAVGSLAAALALAMAARAVARRDAGRSALVAVTASAAVVAAWGALGGGLGWDTVLPGLSIGRGEELFGPFVYANHAGALLAAAAAWCMAVALGVHHGNWLPWLLASLSFGVATAATGSRGGVVLVGVGMALALVLDRRRWAQRAGAAAVAGVAAGGAWLLWAGGDVGAVMAGRPDLWRDTLRVFAAAPWLGVGAGGHGDAGWALRHATGFSTARHAHQEPLQALAEHGVIGAALLGAALCLGLGLAVARLREVRDDRWRRQLAGSVAASGVLLVGGMWDFPLRSGAIALVAAVAFGTALGLSEARPARERARPWGLVAVAAAAAVALVVGATTRVDVDAALRPLDPDPVDAAELTRAEAEIAAVIARRPLSDRALVALAEARYRAGDADGARRALDVARQVAPNALPAWLATARVLRRAGEVDGARAAYRSFLSLDLPYGSEDGYLREAMGLLDDPAAELDLVVPERVDRRCQAAGVLSRAEPAAAEALWGAHRDDPRCAAQLANHLVRAGRPAEALEVAAALEPGCAASRVRGLAHVALGQHADGLRELDEALRLCTRKDVWLRTGIATARLALGDDAGLTILAKVVADRPDLAVPRHRLIEAYVARRHWAEALPLLEQVFLDGSATDQELGWYAQALAEGRPR